MHVWDQQPGESDGAYRAFMTFLELGDSRTLDGAYRAQKGREKGANAPPIEKGRAPGRWTGWCREHRWKERATAYDGRDREVKQQAREEAIATVAARVASDRVKQMLEQEQQEHKIATMIGSKLIEMLNVGLVKRRVAKDETTGAMQIFEPAKWNFGTVARLADIFTRLGRVSLNMPIKVEQEAANDAPYFESSGEMEAAMGEGKVPVMPVDSNSRPPMKSAGGKGAAGLVQPSKPPRPER